MNERLLFTLYSLFQPDGWISTIQWR